MPTATASKTFAPCPEGEDILVMLKAVEEKQNDENARFNKGQIRWMWIFETTEEKDPETEEPYRLTLWTGPTYGDDRATLTKLLDKICRNLSPEEKANFDTETVTGKKFRVDVKHELKPDGTVRAVIDGIPKRAASGATAPAPIAAAVAAQKPIVRTAPAPVADPDDDGEDTDPFSEE